MRVVVCNALAGRDAHPGHRTLLLLPSVDSSTPYDLQTLRRAIEAVRSTVNSKRSWSRRSADSIAADLDLPW